MPKNSRRNREALAATAGEGKPFSKYAAKVQLQVVANRGTLGQVLAEALAEKEKANERRNAVPQGSR